MPDFPAVFLDPELKPAAVLTERLNAQTVGLTLEHEQRMTKYPLRLIDVA